MLRKAQFYAIFFVPKRRKLVPKRKDFLRNEKILNTRGDQAFYMGAENAKIESAEKSAETGGHLSFKYIQKHHPFNISIKHLENMFMKTTNVRYLKC